MRAAVLVKRFHISLVQYSIIVGCALVYTASASPGLCWCIVGTSFEHCGRPRGPTATSPYALYLAHRLEVSQIWTRFHMTETIPALWAFLKLVFLSARPGIVGPTEGSVNSVKLDSSHFASCTQKKKSAHRVGFPFVMVCSSLPGNTAHSSHNRPLCEAEHCG